MKTVWILFSTALALSFIGIRYYERYGSRDLRVTFFDVGQGDAILIQWPKGATWLVDAGGGHGDNDEGRTVLVPELARLGILTLDVAFLTHPDQDHGFGFRSILQELSVREFWWNAAFAPELAKAGLLRELVTQSKVDGVQLRPITLTAQGNLGGAGYRVLTARKPFPKTNDRSLALFLSYGGCQLALTGDLEAVAERALLKEGIPRIDLLKAAHHGSASSTTPEWLEATHPVWTVISAGLRNAYGHPHAQVLERLHRYGSSVLRTDFHGYVRFSVSPSGHVRCESAQGTCGESDCRAKTTPPRS